MQNKETVNLIKKAKRRDADAFTELMQFYMKDLYRVALAILMNDEDAADAIQDTILVCWEKLNTLRQEQYFKTWMTRILINKCYAIRDKALHVVDLATYDEPIAEDRYNLEYKEALSSLDEKYRSVLTLFYSEGYHIDEISAILKIPQSTVKTRLKRGREKLAWYYREYGKE
ncbi:MAG: sigma-70 family RNA polymerase sigma factor [Lachnospiraceae bacterium]|nr:sigma-70 family RNA polymerase sigma factor [Lachnospiraceae bacterium]